MQLKKIIKYILPYGLVRLYQSADKHSLPSFILPACLLPLYQRYKYRFFSSSNLEKVAFSDIFNEELSFILPIMVRLGENCVYYCKSSTKDNNTEAIQSAENAGVRVFVDEYACLPMHKYIMMDGSHQYSDKSNLCISILNNKNIKKIFYTHGTDGNCEVLANNSCILFSSEKQLINSLKEGSTYQLDADDCAVYGVQPDGNEGAVAGLIHMREFGERNPEYKARCRRQLEELLGVSFDSDLPLVVYYTAELLDYKEVDESLERLSAHVNILIKPYNVLRSFAKGERIFLYTKNEMTFLPRFAADFTLGAISSGVLTSSVMLGLPTIPVYTTRLDTSWGGGFDYGQHVKEDRYINISEYAKSGYSEVLRYLSPLCITDTCQLLQRMNDKEYWRKYNTNLSRIQRSVFGRYYTYDAPERAAALIRNVIDKNTLLTEEVAILNKRTTAKQELRSFCDVVL